GPRARMSSGPGHCAHYRPDIFVQPCQFPEITRPCAKGESIYQTLGIAMTPLRTLLLALLFLLASCNVEDKVKAINLEKSDPQKPWEIYATNKETKKPEWWLTWHDNRDECLKNVKHDLTSSIHAYGYTEPAGCMYVGSNNRYVLYIMNKLYNPIVFMCVAKIKNPGEGSNEFRVITNGAPKETGDYRCVLPE
ncbi:MAG: hypothetical protein AB1421_15785, partial [Pseudomonadota bacterium]